MEKRKDSKNRILNKGESQRKDGTYMYRWTDNNKKRQTVYAKTLNELRQKELEITKAEKINGSSWSDGKASVAKAIENYRSLISVRPNTIMQHDIVYSVLKKINILDVGIKDIRVSDAKRYMMSLQTLGYSYGTITLAKSLLTASFNVAVENDFIMKNPFSFKLNSVIQNDTHKKRALTAEEEIKLFDFLNKEKRFELTKNYIIILLGTGMRVSELCGLTYKDVDIENKRIHINKQLYKIKKDVIVAEPKSKSGVRVLAMTDEVRQAFVFIMKKKRPPVEPIINGHTGFIFISEQGNVNTRQNIELKIVRVRKAYKDAGYGDIDFLSPHILRHTFCSRMVEKGVNPKDLQIIMGHSDIGTTLNVYTHKEPEDVAKEMERLMG